MTWYAAPEHTAMLGRGPEFYNDIGAPGNTVGPGECFTDNTGPECGGMAKYAQLATALPPLTPASKAATRVAASPAHFLTAGKAALLGALDATGKMAAALSAGRGAAALADWRADFEASSTEAAGAVSPLSAHVLANAYGARAPTQTGSAL
jgi:hypothetical protein